MDFLGKKEGGKMAAGQTGAKRQSGQIKDGKWLVLVESAGKEGVGFTHNCGTKILGKEVAHPVWNSPFPCSGSGRCQYETVPYCPECEEEPNFHGAPITPKYLS